MAEHFKNNKLLEIEMFNLKSLHDVHPLLKSVSVLVLWLYAMKCLCCLSFYRFKLYGLRCGTEPCS